jgi:hypothetical protein
MLASTCDTLRIYKVRAYLWISYFFDDITTFMGPEKTLIRWSDQRFLKPLKTCDL